jgi:hypothetical protein
MSDADGTPMEVCKLAILSLCGVGLKNQRCICLNNQPNESLFRTLCKIFGFSIATR